MPNSPLRIEHILIFFLLIALLLSLWQNRGAQICATQIKHLRKQGKKSQPRQLKPKTPKDCPDCRMGVERMVVKPRTDVMPYVQRKSSRGRMKRLSTEGHACPNPDCEYFGVVDHQLHALVGDGKRGKLKPSSIGNANTVRNGSPADCTRNCTV